MQKRGAFSAKFGDEGDDKFLENFKNIDITVGSENATLSYNPTMLEYDTAILYVHGFADCFYNAHVVEKYAAKKISFYGLDLRRHGRSIKESNKKFFVENVEEYFEDIDAAIYKILARHNRIILQGFSMGGLVSSLYIHKGFYRKHLYGLILISPLFRFSTSWFQDKVLRPAVLFLAKFFPSLKYTVDMKKYKNYLAKLASGNEDRDNLSKDIPLYLGWLKAMYSGMNQLAANLDIKQPILILSSDKSHKDPKSYKYDADLLLDVSDMKKGATMLGKNVSYVPIADAVHDIFASAEDVQDEAFKAIFKWLDEIEEK